MLAVFRIIHEGYPDWVTGRGGKLFDPERFPFIEGREKGTTRDDATVLPVSDGTILRILDGLMTIEGRSLGGEKIRERLSYRSLDVESIGSVYETVMGFTAARANETMIALRDDKKLPTFIGLDSLLAQKPSERQKWLKDIAIKLTAKQTKAVNEATDLAGLIAAFGTLVDERASPKATALGIGALYLQPTEERRRSGSHYTPRSLTEPIVRHALEPAFARLGDKASPEEVLALKVLDPACGSGAFLVEACRQLGARLEQAWNMHGAEKPVIPPDEDEALHARRLVAQKCLYGVDRNPMAVDLARLSLWLATLAREHEFTFLDHALKAGDSLVGLKRAGIAAAHWDSSKPGLPLFGTMIKEAVERAREGREAIRNAGDDVLSAAQAARYARVLDASEPARIVGDAVIAAFFAGEKPKERESERQKIESWISVIPPKWDDLRRTAQRFRMEHGWSPFHWEIEFPEVFARDNPGFDAIVGNPPFAGKITITAGSGANYLSWLQVLHQGAHGNADLVSHFFRIAFNLLRSHSAFGLIATNTIGQGDTRESGLVKIIQNGGFIYRAVKRYQWPNAGAAVVVSIVHVSKNYVSPDIVLNGQIVNRISAYIVAGDFDLAPSVLAINKNFSFQGSMLLGMGFTFDDAAAAKGDSKSIEEMNYLINLNSKNLERIKPYLGGEEINNSPSHAHHRYAIDFEDFPLARDVRLKAWGVANDKERKEFIKKFIVPVDYPWPVAEDWPDLIKIIELLVKPKRLLQASIVNPERWWMHGRPASKLNTAIGSDQYVLILSRVSTLLHPPIANPRNLGPLFFVLNEGRSPLCPLRLFRNLSLPARL